MNELFPGDKAIGDTNKDKYYRYVGLASEIQPGKSKSFSISDERGKNIDIAVFNIIGRYYAISNTCITQRPSINLISSTLFFISPSPKLYSIL